MKPEVVIKKKISMASYRPFIGCVVILFEKSKTMSCCPALDDRYFKEGIDEDVVYLGFRKHRKSESAWDALDWLARRLNLYTGSRSGERVAVFTVTDGLLDIVFPPSLMLSMMIRDEEK